MKAYKQFIIDVGKLLGGDADMVKRAEEIIEFERKLAKVCSNFKYYRQIKQLIDKSTLQSTSQRAKQLINPSINQSSN